MAQFTVHSTRFDPYKNFKFRVKWDGRYVAGVFRVSPLRRSTQVVEHREDGDPSTVRRSPGLAEYDPIVLQNEGWESECYNPSNELCGDKKHPTLINK